ncbi:MAG: ACP S-malonyltransferase, partial [Actinobacteria bacterium]
QPAALPIGTVRRATRGPPVTLLAVSYAVLFPGQGSQFLGMADPWASDPAGRAVLDEASEAMGRDVVLGCHDEAALATTEFLQPALLACDVAAFEVMRREGAADDPDGVAGHSLGEFAALVAAGSMSLRDALELVVIRGLAMQRAGEEQPGGMTALLGIGSADAEQLCDQVRRDGVLVVANENSPVQVVASGSIPAIERLEALAAERKVRAVRLGVAGAFHSELMRPALPALSEALDAIEIRAPRMSIAENVTGELVTDAGRLRELVSLQLVSPVRWDTGIRSLAGAGSTTFIEVGPGEVLTKLMKRIDGSVRAAAAGSPEAARRAIAAT